jgi:hypothetical protein
MITCSSPLCRTRHSADSTARCFVITFTRYIYLNLCLNTNSLINHILTPASKFSIQDSVIQLDGRVCCSGPIPFHYSAIESLNFWNNVTNLNFKSHLLETLRVSQPSVAFLKLLLELTLQLSPQIRPSWRFPRGQGRIA